MSRSLMALSFVERPDNPIRDRPGVSAIMAPDRRDLRRAFPCSGHMDFVIGKFAIRLLLFGDFVFQTNSSTFQVVGLNTSCQRTGQYFA